MSRLAPSIGRRFLLLLRRAVRHAARRTSGATMTEYALMLALVAVVALGAVRQVGMNASGVYAVVSTALANIGGGAGGAGAGGGNGPPPGNGAGNGGGNGQGSGNGGCGAQC